MARTVRFKVYSFNELSEKAKKVALNWYREFETFDDIQQEAISTLEKFCKEFSIELTDHEIDWHNVRYELDWDKWNEHVRKLSGQRLATYIWNNYKNVLFKGKYYGKLVDTFHNGEKITISKEHPAGVRHIYRHSKCMLTHECVLTGMVYDEIFLDPMYEFLNKPVDIDFFDLFENCVHELFKAVRNEIQDRCKEENLSQSMIDNEYEFTENGKVFFG